MGANDDQASWEHYRHDELRHAVPVLGSLGYILDESQVHAGGERYLMTGARDVGGGGKKLVLSGIRVSDGARVIIKVSSDPEGQREIERERSTRATLNNIRFAQHAFHVPREFLHERFGPLLVSITEYIKEDDPLLGRKTNEQFFLMMQAIESLEGVHATTSAHTNMIRETYGMVSAREYLREFERFRSAACAQAQDNDVLKDLFARAASFLEEHKTLIERYCGFLTHADFVPNNIRISGRTIYLLDSASLRFGNKYESLARLLNWFVHQHPALERMFVEFIRTNRGEEEYLDLRLMRIYKLGYLLMYYAAALHKSDGALRELTQARLTFWSAVMQALLEDRAVSDEALSAYLEARDRLRSRDEIARQKEMIGR